MNIDKVAELLLAKPNLATALGMKFFSTPEPDTCQATMTVDESNCQPYGLLSGGASLALAEELAGVGSIALCPDKLCVGMNVSGNHVAPARLGDTVTATARIIHQGRTTHVWQVRITDPQGKTVSIINVTNYILAGIEAL